MKSKIVRKTLTSSIEQRWRIITILQVEFCFNETWVTAADSVGVGTGDSIEMFAHLKATGVITDLNDNRVLLWARPSIWRYNWARPVRTSTHQVVNLP